MKDIKNIFFFSLAFASTLPVTAKEPSKLKTATPEKIALCSNRLGLASALRDRVVTSLGLVTLSLTLK